MSTKIYLNHAVYIVIKGHTFLNSNAANQEGGAPRPTPPLNCGLKSPAAPAFLSPSWLWRRYSPSPLGLKSRGPRSSTLDMNREIRCYTRLLFVKSFLRLIDANRTDDDQASPV